MCFENANEYPDGDRSASSIYAKSLNSLSERTYGVAGLYILPPRRGFPISHKCLRIHFLCKSRLTLTVSFVPVMVFKKFFARFISQCIISSVFRIKRYCTHALLLSANTSTNKIQSSHGVLEIPTLPVILEGL
jgi:hypothetical protein